MTVMGETDTKGKNAVREGMWKKMLGFFVFFK